MSLTPKPHGALAIAGDSKVPRIHAQNAAFTLHGNLEKPLEELYPTCLKKLTLSKSSYKQAETFLNLSGTNEYSIFPDLDGLSRYLIKKELNRNV